MSVRTLLASAVIVGLVGALVVALLHLPVRDIRPAANQEDVLRLTYPNDPETLNPITANDSVSQAFQRFIYEPLAQRTFANPDTWIPVLATDWTFAEDTLTFLIQLRQGVYWHPLTLPSGASLPRTELTALDVKFTFDVILNPHVEAAHLRSYYEDPEAEDSSQRYKIRVEIVDRYTVRIRWLKPYFQAQEFTLGIGIIPRHVFSVDEHGEPIALNVALQEFADGFNTHWANTKMCGTGPVMYQRWRRNQQLVLVRNPDYWGKPFPFRRIVYRAIPNQNTATHKLLQGDLDLVGIADKDQYLQAQQHPNVIPGQMVPVEDGEGGEWLAFEPTAAKPQGHVALVEYPFPGYRYIGYNLTRDFFKDVRVRRALTHAIPVQTIIDEVFKGLARPTAGPFQPESSAYDHTVVPLAYDLDTARRLLAEAGWQDLTGDGILNKRIDHGLVSARFELMIYADAPAYRTIAEIVKENCRRIGVHVLVAPTKWALMLDRLNTREFDAAMLGWSVGWRQDPFQLWHGSLADVPHSSNFIGYRNPTVDRLIERLRVTLDEAQQVPLYHEIHRRIYQDQPYTFLFTDRATSGYHTRLENMRFYRLRPMTDPTEWRAAGPRDRGSW